MENQALLDRLEEVRSDLKLSKTDFSEVYGVRPQGYSDILAGRIQPNIEGVVNVCQKCKYSANWLLLGFGVKKLTNCEFILLELLAILRKHEL